MNDATVFYFVYINYYRITVENEDRVYITCLDIIYSKGNNIRSQACWVATEKPFPFLIGKVLTYAAATIVSSICAYVSIPYR